MNDTKLFISADMEGITGVTAWDETEGSNSNYQYFRKIMTEEVNAAIEGALENNVTDIVVRDSHNTARNIIPDMLHREAKLIRAWSKSPLEMMEGVDNGYNAVCCIGYHAKSMTPDGILAHTMASDVLDLRVNNISLPELGWNALIAGYYDIPVIFVSGDMAICEQSEKIIPGITTVAVKKGIGEACINLHPQKARELIKQGVKQSLEKIENVSPLKYSSPFTVEIDFRKKGLAARAAWYPGAERKGNFTISCTCTDFMDCMRYFYFVR